MYRIYKIAQDIIMAEEVENDDLTVKLLTALDKKEYVLIKRQEKIAIYNLSLAGHVNEIADDISFEEYRDIIYAKLDKELLEMGIKPKRRDFLRFDRKYFNPEGTISS
ncbi:MAG: hypothetical protein H6Q70_388 [Firmicutes bacterium]|nr:hypothetical protein [Bacillota bacterium]